MASTPGVSATLFDALAKVSKLQTCGYSLSFTILSSPMYDFFQLTRKMLVINAILIQANVNIRGIAQGCSGYNITAVIKRDDCIKALRAVHSRFYLSRTIIAIGIIGPRLMGGTLLDQLSDQARDWVFSQFCSPFCNFQHWVKV